MLLKRSFSFVRLSPFLIKFNECIEKNDKLNIPKFVS
jgi:hypothetical protein